MDEKIELEALQDVPYKKNQHFLLDDPKENGGPLPLYEEEYDYRESWLDLTVFDTELQVWMVLGFLLLFCCIVFCFTGAQPCVAVIASCCDVSCLFVCTFIDRFRGRDPAYRYYARRQALGGKIPAPYEEYRTQGYSGGHEEG